MDAWENGVSCLQRPLMTSQSSEKQKLSVNLRMFCLKTVSSWFKLNAHLQQLRVLYWLQAEGKINRGLRS